MLITLMLFYKCFAVNVINILRNATPFLPNVSQKKNCRLIYSVRDGEVVLQP